MSRNASETIAVFLGGFGQHRLNPRRNVFSSWVKACRSLDKCIINLSRRNRHSLLARWMRLDWILKLACDREVKVHILGYSMGCHLAVKFAHELLTIAPDSVSFGDVYLVAPDPKFIKTELDKHEHASRDGRSAYDEAMNLWMTRDAPGKNFAQRLVTLAGKLPSTVRVVYSKADTVAQWDHNVQTLKEQCEGCHTIDWVEVGTSEREKKDGAHICKCKLKPWQARSEYWIHEQLFANTRILRPRS